MLNTFTLTVLIISYKKIYMYTVIDEGSLVHVLPQVYWRFEIEYYTKKTALIRWKTLIVTS